MSGLGNFLNPSKLLSKDKKLTSSPKKDRTEQSVKNFQLSQKDQSQTFAQKKTRTNPIEQPNIPKELITDQYDQQKNKGRQSRNDQPVQAAQKIKRKSSHEYLYPQEDQKPKRNKYISDTDPQDEQDGFRPRPLRKSSQRSSDEQDNRSNRSGNKQSTAARDARHMTRQRIHDLSQKLENHQQLIKKTSEEFNKKLRRFIDEEFNKFREAILQTVEHVIEQFETEFKQSFEQEHQHVVKDFADVNANLKELSGKLEEMYEEVERAGWRGVLKTLDSQQFQIEIEDAFIIPKNDIGKVELQIDERRLDQFGEALEKLMKVQVVRKKESKRKPKV